MHRLVVELSENQSPWNIFLEVVPPDSGLTSLPPYNKDEDVLLFFKLYDPKLMKIFYCGHYYVPVSQKMRKFHYQSSLTSFSYIQLSLIENCSNGYVINFEHFITLLYE